MNYVGSVSIIDRGDAPAKAVIDKNTRSLAQRVADETKEELDKVLDRVDNIYVSYEMSTQTMFENARADSPNVEYVEDIKELEEIIKDTVKKKKYQQQVTVFIVGFQDVCSHKMQLLQQVNQFFLENSKLDEEELVEKLDIDLEEASTKVTESLTAAEDLAKRLGDLNHDMVDYLVNYANTKASNKNAAGGPINPEKGKKRLEKNLEAAKNDMTSLNEKLLTLQTELEEKDEKFQQVAKQLEGKTQEALRYKTAAEVAKKSAQDNEIHTSTLQDEIKRRDEKIQELRTKVSRMEINLTESQFDKEMSMKRLDNTHVKTKEQMAKLQEDLEQKKIAVNEAERVMEKLHKEQMGILEKSHQQELDDLKKEHMEELAQLTNELSATQRRLKDSQEFAQEATENAESLKTKVIELQLSDTPVRTRRTRIPEGGVTEDRPASGKSIAELSAGEEEQAGLKQDSRPSTKDAQKSTKKSDPKPVKIPSKSPSRGKEKLTSKRDTVDAQDESAEVTKATEKTGEGSRPPAKVTKNLEPVVESGDGQEFTNAFELDDDEAWSSVPPSQVIGRFSQYRKLSIEKLRDLEQQLNVTLTKTHRKVNSLKGQFNEHKSKWETERNVLIEQVEQAQRLQNDAEKEADSAMTQLEEFINEQEKLEDEEQGKRQEIIKTISRQGTEKRASPVERKEPASPEGKETAPGVRIRSENSEQELRNLMQQTDDAKSRTASETPESSLAPWLTTHVKIERPKSEHDSDPMSSRLTFMADAEIQQLVPEDGAETRVSAAVDSEVPQQEKSELKIGGLTAEKEKLRSRTSSKASHRPRTMRPVDEDGEVSAKLQAAEDGNEEEEELPESSLAPWITPAGKKKEKKIPISRQTDYTDDRSPFDIENEVDIEIAQSGDEASYEEEGVSGEIFEKTDTVKKETILPAISRQASRKSSRMSKRSEKSDDQGSGSSRPPLWVTPAAQKKSPKLPVIRQPPPSRQSRHVSAVLDDIEDVDTSEEEAEAEMGMQRSKSQIQRPKTQQQDLKPLKRAKSELRRKIDVDRIQKRKEKAIAKEKAERKQEDEAIADAGKNLLDAAVRKLQEAEEDLNRAMEMEKEDDHVNEGFDREEIFSREEMLNRDVFKDLGDSSRFDNLSIATRSGIVTAREGFESMDEFLNPELSYRPSRAMSKLNESINISEMKANNEGFESGMTGKSTTVMGKATRLSDETIQMAVDTDSETELELGIETERLESHRIVHDDAGRDLDGAEGTKTHGDLIQHSMGKKQQKLYTSMSERAPSRQQSRTSLQRQTASVNVLEREQEAQEKSSRHSGAVSAPPAVEPEEDIPLKIYGTPREDFESRPVTPKTRHPSARHSMRNLSPQKPASVPKQAFRTPRPSIHSAGSPDLQDYMINQLDDDLNDHLNDHLNDDLNIETNEEAYHDPTQSKALHDLKTIMTEDDLSKEQQKTLDSLRSALKSMSSERPPLMDSQLERTVTILSLASQLARESVELGVLPDAVMDGIARMDSRAMSALSGQRSGRRSVKGSALASRGHMRTGDMEGKIVEEMGKSDPTPEKAVAQKEMQHIDRDRQQAKGIKKHEELDSPTETMATYQEHGSVLVVKTDEESKQQDERKNRHRDAMQKYKERKERKERKRQQQMEEQANLVHADDLDRKDKSGKKKAVEKFVNAEPEKDSERVKTKEEINRKIAELKAELEAATDESKLLKKQQEREAKQEAKQMKMQKAEDVDDRQQRRRPISEITPVETKQHHELPTETSFSGSLNMGARSSRDDSFSVSLPGTITSSEWRRLSPDNPLYPVKQEDGKVAVNVNKQHATVTQNEQENPSAEDFAGGQKEEDIIQVDIHETKPAKRAGGVDIRETKPAKRAGGIDIHETKPAKRAAGGVDIHETKPAKRAVEVKKKARIVTQGEMHGDMRELCNPLADNYYRMEVIGVGHKFIKLLDKDVGIPKTPEPEIVQLDQTNTPATPQTQVTPQTQATPVTPQTQVTPVTPQTQVTPVTPQTQPQPPTSKSPTSESSPRSVSRLRKSSSAKSKQPQLPSYSTTLPQESITPPTGPPAEPSITSVESLPTTSHSHYSQTGHTSCITPGTSVSDVQRPVSISSVQPVICPTPPPQMCKETQTDPVAWPLIEREPIKGDTEDEVRESSAKSRASLRKEFKSRLDETRHLVEERRTKSPAISVPSQKSVEGELIIDDDDDDLPIPDELKDEVFRKEDDEDSLDAGSPVPDKTGTGSDTAGSPVLGKAGTGSDSSRQSQKLGEHPIVKEYLRAYTGIHNFKEAMSRVLVDKDQMSASQILTELNLIQFDKETKVVPQIETMTENIYYVLNEVSQVINSVLQNDRGPVVSSLMMGMSRDPTQRTITREKTGQEVPQQIPPTRSTQRSGESTDADRQQFTEMQDQYTKFSFDVKITKKVDDEQSQMSEDAKRYEDQQRHNMVVMMEMQDTINQLQRELSALGKQPKRPQSDNMSTATASNVTESAVMFTRLDSDRNAKIMKKAINDRRLDADKYKRAMVQMDEYVSLPAQRLTHLVRKYVHHCRMKEIEDNVQKSRSLNENVFEILDKMESLQNQRAKRWADRMDEMGNERLRLANMLMDTLDGIEQESGIFLIKPMYSYRGREPKERYSGRISRPFRPHRTLSPVRDVQSSFAPAPTPASNVRPVVRQQQSRPDMGQLPQSQESVQTRYEPPRPLEGDNTGLMGSSMNYVGTQPRATWNMMDSQPRPDLYGQNNMNTPRILELDINRMMIGQNTISSTIGLQGLSNDRLVNASNSNLRSYMTVNRPSGPGSGGKTDRPNSAGSRHGDSHGSPSPTNQSSSAKRVRMSESEVPSVMSMTQPLPPITPTGSRPQSGSNKGRMSPTRIPIAVDIPHSPPGSSLRQSPPAIKDTEVISPIK